MASKHCNKTTKWGLHSNDPNAWGKPGLNSLMGKYFID